MQAVQLKFQPCHRHTPGKILQHSRVRIDKLKHKYLKHNAQRLLSSVWMKIPHCLSIVKRLLSAVLLFSVLKTKQANNNNNGTYCTQCIVFVDGVGSDYDSFILLQKNIFLNSLKQLFLPISIVFHCQK